MNSVLTDIEMPLVPVLARIERQGALVDAKLLGVQSVELGDKMVALEREAFEIAGEEFNLSSPKQLGVILYEKLGLPIISKTAKVSRPPPRPCSRSWPSKTSRCLKC